jgi:hypothetical protein
MLNVGSTGELSEESANRNKDATETGSFVFSIVYELALSTMYFKKVCPCIQLVRIASSFLRIEDA